MFRHIIILESDFATREPGFKEEGQERWHKEDGMRKIAIARDKRTSDEDGERWENGGRKKRDLKKNKS